MSNDVDKNWVASWLIAAVLFVSLCAFVSGYFIGIRHGAQAFLCAQHDELLAGHSDDTGDDAAEAVDGQMSSAAAGTSTSSMPTPSGSSAAALSVTPRSFWAIGATVDHYVYATHLMEQAARVSVVMRIKKVATPLPHGRKKVAYHLVTPRYATQEQLEEALARLKKIPVWAKHLKITINKD